MSEMIVDELIVKEHQALEIATLLMDLWKTLLRVLKGRVCALSVMQKENNAAMREIATASHLYRYFHSIFFNGCLGPTIFNMSFDLVPAKYRRTINHLDFRQLSANQTKQWDSKFDILNKSGYKEVSFISLKYIQFLVTGKVYSNRPTTDLNNSLYNIEGVAQECYLEFKKVFEMFLFRKFERQFIVEDMNDTAFSNGLFPYDKSLLYSYKVISKADSKIKLCTSNCLEANYGNLIRIFVAEFANKEIKIVEEVAKKSGSKMMGKSSGSSLQEEVGNKKRKFFEQENLSEVFVDDDERRRKKKKTNDEEEIDLVGIGSVESSPKGEANGLLLNLLFVIVFVATVFETIIVEEEVVVDDDQRERKENQQVSIMKKTTDDEEEIDLFGNSSSDEEGDRNKEIPSNPNPTKKKKKKTDEDNDDLFGNSSDDIDESSSEDGGAKKTRVLRRRRVKQEPQDEEANELSSQSAICDFFVAKVFDSTPNATDAVAQLKITKEKHPDIKYSKIIADAG